MYKALRKLFVVVLFFTYAYNICGKHISLRQKNVIPVQSEESLAKKYATSLAAGSIVGSTVGIINAIIDDHCYIPFLNRFIAIGTCESIVRIIIKDMEARDIAHEKYIMRTCAWAASYLSYIYYHKYMH